MSHYLIEYYEGDASNLTGPQYFYCEADNAEHAQEQCDNAYPQATITRIGLISWEKAK